MVRFDAQLPRGTMLPQVRACLRARHLLPPLRLRRDGPRLRVHWARTRGSSNPGQPGNSRGALHAAPPTTVGGVARSALPSWRCASWVFCAREHAFNVRLPPPNQRRPTRPPCSRPRGLALPQPLRQRTPSHRPSADAALGLAGGSSPPAGPTGACGSQHAGVAQPTCVPSSGMATPLLSQAEPSVASTDAFPTAAAHVAAPNSRLGPLRKGCSLGGLARRLLLGPRVLPGRGAPPSSPTYRCFSSSSAAFMRRSPDAQTPLAVKYLPAPHMRGTVVCVVFGQEVRADVVLRVETGQPRHPAFGSGSRGPLVGKRAIQNSDRLMIFLVSFCFPLLLL